MTKTDPDAPVVIKKYANRRLYNTESSCYVTLDHLADMVKEGREFVVRDAKTSEDITRSVLTQIIFEQENKGQTLLPVPFLRQLISFYGDRLETMVPSYLQSSMEAFTRNQEQFRKAVIGTPMQQSQQAMAIFDEMTRQNMAMFENAVRMFNPSASGSSAGQEPMTKAEEPSDTKEAQHRIDALQAQLAEMQRQLDKLVKS